MDELVLLLLGAGLALICGPIALVFALVQRSKVKRLEQEIRGLEQALYSLRGRAFGMDSAEPPAKDLATAHDDLDVPSAVSVEQDLEDPGSQRAPEPAVQNSEVPAPTLSAPATPKEAGRKGIEHALAANWMVWVGGIAIAMGGLFLVRVAIDVGLFGPLARVIMASVLGGGLVAAGLNADKWSWVREGEGMVGRLPEVLSATGVTTLYGATVGAGLLYGFVPPLVALGLFVAVSILAVMLALKFGLLLAALGFVGAFVGPLLTGSPGGDVLPLLPYFCVVAVAGLYLVQLRNWRFVTSVILAGVGLWGFVATGSFEVARHWAVPAYGILIGVAGLWFGERGAREKRKSLMINPFRDVENESVFAAYGFWILAGVLIVLSGVNVSLGDPWQQAVTVALAIYGGIGLLVTWQRHGYALIAPISAIISVVALMIWRESLIDMSATPIAFAIGFGVLGTLLMMRAQEDKAALAFVAALMPPVMLFIAFWRGGLVPGFAWGLGAATMALCLGAVLEWIGRQDGGHDRRPGQTIAFAVGAGLSAALAPFLVLHGIWLSPALAVVAAMLAFVWRRFPYEPLRFTSLGALASSVFLMMRPGLLRDVSLSEMPIVNEITGLFSVAIGAIVLARWAVRYAPNFARAFEGAAWILGFGWIGLTIRHIAGGGDLYDGDLGLGEASAYAISYLGAAASLGWRMRAPGIWMRSIETLALLLGIGGILLVGAATIDHDESYADVLLLALPAWLLPTLLVAVLAIGWQRRGYAIMSRIAAGFSMLIGLIWVTVETISLFELLHFDDDGMWIFSAAWIIYAFILLAIAIWRGSGVVRFGSLAVLILSILKVFLFDLSNLDGVARAGSFIGLGVALIAAALFYQRFVFRQPPAAKALEPGT